MRVFIVLLLLCDAVLFFAALVSSAPPPAVHVAVLGEPRVSLNGSPWVGRVSAVLVEGQGAAEVQGDVRGNAGAALDSAQGAGIIAMPFSAEGTQSFRLNLGIGYQAHVFVDCTFEVAATAGAPALVHAKSAALPTILGARTTTLTLEPGPIEAGKPLTVVVTPPSPERIAVDVLVNGVQRSVKIVDANGAARVALEVPTDAPAGALVVVHAAAPWPDARGPWVAARVREGVVDLGADEPARLRAEPLTTCHQLPAPSPSDGLRFTFEAVSALITLMIAAAMVKSARGDVKRGVVLAALMVIVVAAAFGGLDVVLRMGLGLHR